MSSQMHSYRIFKKFVYFYHMTPKLKQILLILIIRLANNKKQILTIMIIEKGILTVEIKEYPDYPDGKNITSIKIIIVVVIIITIKLSFIVVKQNRLKRILI